MKVSGFFWLDKPRPCCHGSCISHQYDTYFLNIRRIFLAVDHVIMCIMQVHSFLLLSSIPSYVATKISLYSKKSLLSSDSQRWFLMLSFGSFIASAFIFRFMIHFENTFFVWYEVSVEVHSFQHKYPVIPPLKFLSSLYFLNTFIENQMIEFPFYSIE